jgi:threonine/homoserine efflux transporter RhtA
MRKTNNMSFRIIFGSAIIISLIRLFFFLTEINIAIFMDIILFFSGCLATYLLYRNRRQMSFIALIVNSMILTIISIVIYEFSRGIITNMSISFYQILNRVFVSINVILIFTVGNIIVAVLCKKNNEIDIIDKFNNKNV